tara:strand:- start:205 stop:792 length:588 start_codon:yes stop_codon:yes gene_type:complete
MKNLAIFIFLFLLLGCASGKKVYWCGDHPCSNKKEKQAYFLKTGVVELKNLKKIKDVKKSELHKITKEESIKNAEETNDDEKISKQARLEEKSLLKKARLEEKKETKIEINDCSNAKKLHKKLMCRKEEEKITKTNTTQVKKDKKNKNEILDKSLSTSDEIAKIDISDTSFGNLVEKISEKNKSKPYPDINDIPN